MTSSIRLDFSLSPWVLDLLTHLWQSTAVALVILLFLGLIKGLSARTRCTLGWIAVAKFFAPVAWLIAWITPTSTETWLSSRLLVVPNLNPASVDVFAGSEIHVMSVLVMAWVLVTLVLLARWVTRAIRVPRRILASSCPLPEKLIARVTQAAARVGLVRPPKCAMVADNHGPGLIGVFAPVLVLPRGLAEDVTPTELDAILIHECVHQQRHDNFWSGARAVFLALFWFNPVAWVLNRSIAIETEKACDERVLEISGDAGAYARGIVAAVRHGLGMAHAGFAGATTPPVLERIQAILSFASRRERPLVRRLVIMAGLALVGLSGQAGSIAAESANPAPQPSRYKIGKITITFVGSPNVSEDAVREVMQMRAGGTFDEVILDRDVRALYRTGWFKLIEVKHTPVDGMTYNLVVELTPKPADGAGDSTVPAPSPSAPSLGERQADLGERELDLNAARQKLNDAKERLKKLREENARLKQERDGPAAGPEQVKEIGESRSAAAAAAGAPSAKPVYDIAELDQKPVPRFQARPRYPFEMRRAGIRGEVVVDFVVNNEGDVVNAFALRSTQVEFEAPAVEAVSKWKFRPGQKGGQAVHTHMQVPIVFSLSQ
jgi:TonB family protein